MVSTPDGTGTEGPLPLLAFHDDEVLVNARKPENEAADDNLLVLVALWKDLRA
jgi:hypothetical protein